MISPELLQDILASHLSLDDLEREQGSERRSMIEDAIKQVGTPCPGLVGQARKIGDGPKSCIVEQDGGIIPARTHQEILDAR